MEKYLTYRDLIELRLRTELRNRVDGVARGLANGLCVHQETIADLWSKNRDVNDGAHYEIDSQIRCGLSNAVEILVMELRNGLPHPSEAALHLKQPKKKKIPTRTKRRRP